MDPAQLLTRLRKGAAAPSAGYVFLGNELFTRDGCRRALVEAALRDEDREAGLVEYDLGEAPLATVIDDARTLSLFARARLIAGYNAENVLPRGREVEDEENVSEGGSELLDLYFRDPTPGVVLLFEATKFDWNDRDERKKLERLDRFFRAVPVHVELRRLDPAAALEAARSLARTRELRISDALLAELTEALGHDMARIANEISKLALYAADTKGEITRDTLAALVPEARTSGIFELTDALASKNRTRALQILETLTRMDVYLPLQVTFLAGLFRHALAVKESGARNEAEVSRLFTNMGLPIWPARARQALDTAKRFSREQLERAMTLLFETDRDLRRDRPDDHLIVEKLVWELTR